MVVVVVSNKAWQHDAKRRTPNTYHDPNLVRSPCHFTLFSSTFHTAHTKPTRLRWHCITAYTFTFSPFDSRGYCTPKELGHILSLDIEHYIIEHVRYNDKWHKPATGWKLELATGNFIEPKINTSPSCLRELTFDTEGALFDEPLADVGFQLQCTKTQSRTKESFECHPLRKVWFHFDCIYCCCFWYRWTT